MHIYQIISSLIHKILNLVAAGADGSEIKLELVHAS